VNVLQEGVVDRVGAARARRAEAARQHLEALHSMAVERRREMGRGQCATRFLMVATALVLATSPAMAGGGQNPPPPGLELVKVPDVKATIVMDPHGNQNDLFCVLAPCGTFTSTGQSGAIVLQGKRDRQASATFPMPVAGTFGNYQFGCDPTLTDARFLNSNPSKKSPGNYAPMVGFIPQATLEVLFSQIGVDINPVGGPKIDPAITKVKSQGCSDALPADSGVTGPGYLTLEVEIGFWAAEGTKIIIK
jgi:hypothetical protein